MDCSTSGFQTGRGVMLACWITQSRRPATALPLVPSTCKVSRSSRRTRVVQDELKWAMTPFSSSKVP
jgi:hypothetical protein